jgi:PEGA domain
MRRHDSMRARSERWTEKTFRAGVLSCLVSQVFLFPALAHAEGGASASPAAAAQPSPEVKTPTSSPRPLLETLSPEALREYEAARLLFQDGDFGGASAKFNLAYQLSGDPRLLWNQAVCEKEQRHYARATTLIERYLKEGVNLVEPDKRRDAQGILEALRQFSSPVELKGAPAGATVEVDGSLVGKIPLASTLHLDLGRHSLRIEAPGYRPFLQLIEVPGAVTVRVPVRMIRELLNPELSITAHPRSSTIRVDGVVVGQGSWAGPIAPGTHDIVIDAPGKTASTRKIEVRPGQRHALDVHLESAKVNKAWPWIVLSAVVVAGGATAGVWAASNGPLVGPEGSLGSLDARQK